MTITFPGLSYEYEVETWFIVLTATVICSIVALTLSERLRTWADRVIHEALKIIGVIIAIAAGLFALNLALMTLNAFITRHDCVIMGTVTKVGACDSDGTCAVMIDHSLQTKAKLPIEGELTCKHQKGFRWSW